MSFFGGTPPHRDEVYEDSQRGVPKCDDHLRLRCLQLRNQPLPVVSQRLLHDLVLGGMRKDLVEGQARPRGERSVRVSEAVGSADARAVRVEAVGDPCVGALDVQRGEDSLRDPCTGRAVEPPDGSDRAPRGVPSHPRLQFSTRSTSSSPVQKGVGSLSTAIAAIGFHGFRGTHRTCKALG